MSNLMERALRGDMTLPVETRVDVRSLATLARFFARKGVPITTKSFLLKTIVEGFLEILETNALLMETDRVVDAETALNVFKALGYGSVASPIQTKKLLEKAVVSSTLFSTPDSASPTQLEDMIRAAAEKLEKE